MMNLVVIDHEFVLANVAFKEGLMKVRCERLKTIVDALFDVIKKIYCLQSYENQGPL